MKRQYIIPQIEILNCQLQSHLFQASLEGGGNASENFEEGVEGDVKNQGSPHYNVWDDDWSKQQK